jgi:hypothetical protein
MQATLGASARPTPARAGKENVWSPPAKPTLNIRISEFFRYRGKVVSTRCPQIFSVGKNAIQTTLSSGKTTSAAIAIAPSDHGSGLKIEGALYI